MSRGYRVWDKENEEYMNGYDVLLKYDGSAISRYALVTFDTDMPVNVIIEPYTGLKDKNGKKIYVGDIVKFADLELAMKPAGVVCFSDGKFFIKDWEFDDGSYHIVDFYDYNIPHKDFEVIGNIHENPELLEDK